MKVLMRLFIAVNFEEKVKLKLIEAQNYLKKYAVHGNFTEPKNLHLTLVFLGEIESNHLPKIKSAIDRIDAKPFKICINNLGRFKKEGGDIYWIGVKPSFGLTQLQSSVIVNLKEIGLDFSTDRFSPHITIARQTYFNKDFNEGSFNRNFENVYSEVKRISLMESIKISEKLVYTEIYSQEFVYNLNNTGN